jgi:hypothetical protein
MLLAAIVALQVVKFCGITYSAKVETAAFSYETFGNKLLECFVQPVRSLPLSKRPAELQILKGIDGYIMPGSMTLVLGPPGNQPGSVQPFTICSSILILK